MSNSLQTRLISIIMQLIDPAQSTVGFRFYLWEAAWAMFRASPVFGVGPDNFRLLLPAFASSEAASFLRLEIGRTYSPHHAGLQLLSETGLIGIVTFSLIVVAYCRYAYGIWRYAARQRQLTGVAAGLWLLAVISSLAMLYGGYAYGGYTQIGILYVVLVGATIRQHQLIRQQATP